MEKLDKIVVGLLLAAFVGLLFIGVWSAFIDSPTSPPVHGLQPEAGHEGAAVASLEERIYLSEVIVRARLRSAANNVATFRTIEYLKGKGPSTLTVSVNTSERSTQ